MTVILTGPSTIELSGDCTIDDAEPLLGLLLSSPGSTVDWRACHHLHAAVVQVLLAARPVLLGPPAGRFQRTMLARALDIGDYRTVTNPDTDRSAAIGV